MYKCPNCKNVYQLSAENSKLLPTEHIIECPHCGNQDHIIGSDLEIEAYGGTKEKPVHIMYGRSRRDDEDISKLLIIKGEKSIELLTPKS